MSRQTRSRSCLGRSSLLGFKSSPLSRNDLGFGSGVSPMSRIARGRATRRAFCCIRGHNLQGVSGTRINIPPWTGVAASRQSSGRPSLHTAQRISTWRNVPANLSLRKTAVCADKCNLVGRQWPLQVRAERMLCSSSSPAVTVSMTLRR